MTPLISTPITEDLVRGALELERIDRGLLPHRLPARARRQCADPQLAMAESQPAGVRLALRTRATVLEVDVVPTKRVYAGAPARPDGVHDLFVDGRLVAQQTALGGDTLVIDMATGTAELRPGSAATLRFAGLPEGDKDVELWLPHDETTVLVGLRSDAEVAPLPAAGHRVWLHHGSSISQGSNAATPSGTWPAVAAIQAGVDLVNLGLGGSALLDPFTARAMRDVPADLVSVKIGLNLVNLDLMRVRAFGPAVHGFLDTIRDGHPDTPMLVVSPLFCPIHEDTPGPGAFDTEALATGVVRFRATGDRADPTRLTLAVIRDELARIVEDRADPRLAYLDGRELYGPADHDELPLPDALHLDPAAHRRVGERFAVRLREVGHPNGSSPFTRRS